MKYDRLVEKIHYRYQPKTEDEWLTADETGFTIAHYYAIGHALPVDFPHWHVSDATGWTVAHVAASHKKLPIGFNNWSLADSKGDSVAHIAARLGCLPIDLQFDRNIYNLTNHKGESVLQIIRSKVGKRVENLKAIIES